MAFAIRKRLTDLVAHSAPAREDIHVSHLARLHPETRISGCSFILSVSSGPGFVRPLCWPECRRQDRLLQLAPPWKSCKASAALAHPRPRCLNIRRPRP